MGDIIEKSRARIRNINWNYENSDKPSSYVLVSEFIRRGNDFLDFHSKDNNRRAVFNAAEIAVGDLAINIKEICPELDQVDGDWVTEYLNL
ncbi:hypothetical protein [Paenibacillus apiarius]|uniref:hypothetical protein n=1 Tax=Paenibacillus apiarius TaxID=46240 RepID=UPI00197EC7B4|nr:hypothetical protein [Paenibacillus apiarius]MBN3522630.1 hypothetical protein [Paenibacillus apiarius]